MDHDSLSIRYECLHLVVDQYGDLLPATETVRIASAYARFIEAGVVPTPNPAPHTPVD